MCDAYAIHVLYMCNTCADVVVNTAGGRERLRKRLEERENVREREGREERDGREERETCGTRQESAGAYAGGGSQAD